MMPVQSRKAPEGFAELTIWVENPHRLRVPNADEDVVTEAFERAIKVVKDAVEPSCLTVETKEA